MNREELKSALADSVMDLMGMDAPAYIAIMAQLAAIKGKPAIVNPILLRHSRRECEEAVKLLPGTDGYSVVAVEFIKAHLLEVGA
jgi:hypothetical protein